jgi:hypothetical protein
VLDDSALADVFGIEMAEISPPTPVKRRSKATATNVVKSETKSATARTTKRSVASKSETAKEVPVKKLVKTKALANASAGLRKSPAKTTVTKARKGDTAKPPKPPKPKAVSRRTKSG